MPYEDEYQKSVQLKLRYCLVLEYHNSFDSPNNSRSFNLSFGLNALITFRVILTNWNVTQMIYLLPSVKV